MHRKRWFVLAGVVAAVVALAFLVAACGGDGDGDGDGEAEPTATVPADQTPADATNGMTVDVYHAEWYLEPSVDKVPAGTVTINARNDGSIPHNFRMARTDLDADALPVDEDAFTVEEDQLDMVARSTEDLQPGEVEPITLDLPPGRYVLFCNIPSHYQAGLYHEFIVE